MNEKSTYSIKNEIHYDNEIIVQKLYRLEQEVSMWVLNTREESIRKSLISLGWTPPQK